MAKPLKILFSLLVGATTWAASLHSAHAYCRSTTCVGECQRDEYFCKLKGERLYWNSSCIGFSLQKDASIHFDLATFESIAVASFVEWTERSCSPQGDLSGLAFVRQADVSCAKAEYNPSGRNANILLFQDNRWTYSSVDNTLAKTTVSYDVATGEILDADIEFNHAYNEFTYGDDTSSIAYDLQSIMTHEIGHFIGLDHSDLSFATMSANYRKGEIDQRSLEEDDIAGLCAVYPPGLDLRCEPTPKGGFSKVCAEELDGDCGACRVGVGTPAGQQKQRGIWSELLIVATLLLGRRRRRSKH
jgi:hypothetical protein